MWISTLWSEGLVPLQWAAVIGASSGGVRTFTATSSQGLALMHELLHWASAARLPIVMGVMSTGERVDYYPHLEMVGGWAICLCDGVVVSV